MTLNNLSSFLPTKTFYSLLKTTSHLQSQNHFPSQSLQCPDHNKDTAASDSAIGAPGSPRSATLCCKFILKLVYSNLLHSKLKMQVLNISRVLENAGRLEFGWGLSRRRKTRREHTTKPHG